ncbi:restriction endonuclease subunit S [Mucilaginibacter rubeus]|uniref:Restriction endonuclease subunit S n=1 Tax=Mucilaginibacter rubeus TaxID=2027860 RepID=A0AAE6JKT9_9SPHI|nr:MULTISPECIES: restriction endonuclease subunit S [Mucilaginibacter]QEM07253.1 restriction endonuclease subunit S [Mucilaginibacter rubeus]QEM19708.1 restriction endonuclease subunit S [Mucilaginibacter gossypii]QTE43594.1 restriction endonuclease subunit S [Mucilaginibacter rubeus]QTE50194.1 restriction endonuclease subunit S [Mucilaginibacter rubeus]QTE55282.1 restriction endonuclease subunit S [Mucilaginibacter rubeus]
MTPKTWKNVALSDLFIFIGGGTPDKSNLKFWNGDIPWASVKDIKYEVLNDTIDRITAAGLENSSSNLAVNDDLLLVTRISPGEVTICKNSMAINQDLKIVKRFGGISPLFSYYLIKAHKQKFLERASGTTIKGIRLADLDEIVLPLPPVQEQIRIVNAIQEYFSEIEDAKKEISTALKRLDIYKQLVLYKAFDGTLLPIPPNEYETGTTLIEKIQNDFQNHYRLNLDDYYKDFKLWQADSNKGLRPVRPSKPQAYVATDAKELESMPTIPKSWKWEKLGNFSFVTKLAGFEFSKYIKYESTGDIPVIKAQNVSKGGFSDNEYSYVTREMLTHLPRIKLSGGEILFVFVGAGLGNVGVVPLGKEYMLGPNVALIKPSEYVFNKYVQYFLSSPIGKKHILELSKATAQGSISMENIRNISIPLCNFEQQTSIINKLDTLLTHADHLIDMLKIALIKADNFKSYILDNAFKGKLTDQNLDDENVEILLNRIKVEKEQFLSEQKIANKFKQSNKITMEPLKSIIEILMEKKKPVFTKDLWKLSVHKDDIEAFFAELKLIEAKIQVTYENQESLISLVP